MTRRQAPTGILGFPVTPLDDNGKVDEIALAQNIQFLIDEGLESIFIACGSGEYQSLSSGEYELLVDIALDVTKGRVPVYTGVGGHLPTSLEWAQLSADKGADGYLVFPPYLVGGEQKGLVQYYKTIIESTDLDAILYQRGQAVFSTESVQELAELPQVVGVKDGIGNMERNVQMTQTIGDRMGWLNGMPMAEVTMPAYVPLGFNSYSSAISNYIPHISRAFYEALLAQRMDDVRQMYQEVILPINAIRNQRQGYAVSLIKAGMEIMGHSVKNTARPPILPVEPEHYKQLEAILKRAHELYPKRTAIEHK
ncbi:5-dehydro-4-deoxyglucarate dehydratase [Aureibacillus halotolerans]|uniref:Probable 5-dehydro-4-deoxyglucarate dehydratase n=1 Tax=Aureibacillus halotolerans TaxID=1508390 RepID=A0A4R6UDL4_9BACI|nr:5-dehydro-4-deoxyglucarate dehydratase [Aureibacillus halotolerans]TDQ41184.1 5-dehydro-4-deoxyglucarate dehydratase [Aureibacillus halotolerans]